MGNFFAYRRVIPNLQMKIISILAKAVEIKMKRLQRLVTLCAFILGCGATASALAAAEPSAAATAALAKDAVCTACHNESWRTPVLSYYQTKHGNKADPRTPGCTSCHGASEGHLSQGPGTKPDVVFATKGQGPAKTTSSAEAQNGQCLSCHQKDSKRSHWAGSTHENRGLACANCHTVHAPQDKVLTKITQPEVCFTCHKQQRTEINRTFRHPILEGKVACSDCHNPHGSVSRALMKRDSVVETCYQCHAEKRGPFVHNHEPVQEDCTNCHNPHGTVADSMLKVRPPFLCHQCHTPHGGNVAQVTGQNQTNPAYGPLLSATTSGKSGINYTMARGCLNCHTQIHGGNNPSATNPPAQFMFR
jgi:DmsE family decaheme c-type cytochrome